MAAGLLAVTFNLYRFPVPGALLWLTVIYAAWRCGLYAALASSIIAVAALSIALSSPGGPLWSYDHRDATILVFWLVVLPGTAVCLGLLRRRFLALLRAPAREQEELFAAVLGAMHDALVQTDFSGIRQVNDSFCRMTGFAREELIGAKPPYPFWPEEQYAAIAAALEHSMRGQAQDFELVLSRKNGERFPAILAVSRLPGRGGRTIYSFRDISDLKRAQQELRESQERLLATLSHQLRIPLMPALATASALQEDPHLPAGLRDDLAAIHRNVLAEAHLIDNLVDFVEPRIAPAPAAVTARPGLRILLVEDHPDTNQIMSRLLRRLGYHVTAADSVASATAALAAERFDLLVCDIGLPDGSGTEIMTHLRQAAPGTPGIALSGLSGEDDLRRSREAGFAEHLIKPLDIAGLEAAILRAAAPEAAQAATAAQSC